MKAMTLNEYGDNAEFKLTEINDPIIKPGHVIVRVASASVNTVDTMIRQMGKENLPLSPDLPAVLGMDFAGIIEEVGEGVTSFQKGDEVYGCAGGLLDLKGSLAELILADEKLIAKKPETLSMREAAAIPLVGITAYEGLMRANVAEIQNVLVHGGAGGVGHIAVQLAKYMGTNVYATGTGNSHLNVIEQYGATFIDFREETVSEYVEKHTNGNGFDMIFDAVGGANMLNSFEAAALNAQISTTVAMLDLDLTMAHFKGLSIHVVFMLIPMIHNYKREEHGIILAKLAKIVDEGKLTPLLDEEKFALEDVGKAYNRLTSGQAIGKVVIELKETQ